MLRLADHEQALLRSQSGSLAGVAFSTTPSSFLNRIGSHLFRVLLLRLHVSVVVAVLLMLLATIDLHGQEFWEGEVSLWRVLTRAFVAKEAPEW